MATAPELHSRGVTAINSGRLRTARTLLERAQERTDEADGELRARIEASLAFVTAETGDAAGALALCERALGRAGLSAETRGVVESQRALLLMRRGETVAALSAFEAAIGSLADNPAELGKAHLNRGGVYLQQGQPDRALVDFAAASEHLESAGLTTEAAMSRHNLGYAQLLLGNLVDALREMDAAREVLAPMSPLTRAICDQDRAEVLMAAGLSTEGRHALREAARTYGLRRFHQRRGEAELVLARSVLLADPAESLAAARAARRRFTRTGSDAWRVRADGVALAAAVELGRDGPALVDQADSVARQLDEQGLVWNATLVRLHAARVLVRRGEYAAARARLAGVRLGSSTPLAVRMLARSTRVELARAEGRRSAAVREVRAGLTELHRWQSTFGSLDLQTSAVGRGQRLAIYGLELAAASRRPEVVLEWSERARMLASRIRPVRPPADEQLVRDLAELRGLVGAGEVVGEDLRRHDQLRRRVRERALRNVGSGEVADPVTLAELQAALDPGTVLASYLVTPDRVVGLAVGRTSARVHDLGPRAPLQSLLGGLFPDLDMAGSDLPGAFAGVVRGELVARLEALSALLVAPLSVMEEAERVVVTPSGVLAGLPWGLLPGLAGRAVTVARSATSWTGRDRGPLAADAAGFVAGPRVGRAEAEVRAAAALWPRAELVVGAGATASAVTDLASRVGVLHVSAHGRHSAENPLFSGLELHDGPWYGYDIDRLERVPDVVLLSACELGRSQVRHGEELIGMTTAWLHAGARSVIASAAAVHDDVAHDVLLGVHRGLSAGLDPAAALAAALPPAGPDAPPAPFVCFG